ncbi:hypothetical protein B0H94_10449 [Salsuginibacillus halophilus]|uniref:Uncharacterized protein n=1 Tax=Salsuginibacillus halophilus TaxID=517424 RepID=A0A2P8HQF7_9BACI|nr:hypothetical protein B0H94_10449 [Salsuginibacillus halophilus]
MCGGEDLCAEADLNKVYERLKVFGAFLARAQSLTTCLIFVREYHANKFGVETISDLADYNINEELLHCVSMLIFTHRMIA